MAKKDDLLIGFDEVLENDLKDPEFAAAYLNAHLEINDEVDEELFLEAISKIIEAYGATNFSKSSNVPVRTLYSAFFEKGNPRFKTLTQVLDQVGVSLQFVPKKTGS